MALLPLLLVLVLVVVITAGLAIVQRTPPTCETAVAAARRHAVVTAGIALFGAAVAALGCVAAGLSVIPGPGTIGRSVLLAPVAAGIAHTVVLLLGELSWPRPQGDVRRARLTRRGLLDAAPRWLVRLAGGLLVALFVVLAVGALSADYTGRRILVTFPLGGAASGPYPGLFYSGPAALGVVVLVVGTLAALRVVADRPAVATDDGRVETALRRASAHRVLRGATAAGLALLAGLLLAVGTALHNFGAVGMAGAAGYGAVGTAVVVVGFVAGLLAVVVACIRAPAVPADDAVPTG